MNENNLNRLQYEKSPYLLQHAGNPIDWYPWGEEAFSKARREDKPVFLSIGYSTCHWCHVMAHESFEDKQVADLLGEGFVSIKVDREERPDIDSIYMSVCQQMTGSGGWPTSIFMTPDQKPFFAGTYFPKNPQYGLLSFPELLTAVSEKWKNNRKLLVKTADEAVRFISTGELKTPELIEGGLPHRAYDIFKKTYDSQNGGFGAAPKFPSPHNLLFLLKFYEKQGEPFALEMAEHTLIQMYKGGLFDHIGYGFSRYSTDKYFLAPHFEKMLYDNALLLLCYAHAYKITKKQIYKAIAQKTALYIEREMTSPDGAFYSAQDADSDGIEGSYYIFDYDEIIDILGEKHGQEIISQYGITKEGNFEGKNILNLLHLSALNHKAENPIFAEKEDELKLLYEYRKSRHKLHLDDKILTSQNSLMIAALAYLSEIFEDEKYLAAAESAAQFLENNLAGNNTLYVSFRDGKRSREGFIDDYAFYILALLYLHDAYDKQGDKAKKEQVLDRAETLAEKAVADFFDKDNGGFFLYGEKSERLITRPKDIHDGAIPSGNSAMAYSLLRLSELCPDFKLTAEMDKHFKYMSNNSRSYAAGFGFFMTALLNLDQNAALPQKFCCREDGTCF